MSANSLLNQPSLKPPPQSKPGGCLWPVPWLFARSASMPSVLHAMTHPMPSGPPCTQASPVAIIRQRSPELGIGVASRRRLEMPAASLRPLLIGRGMWRHERWPWRGACEGSLGFCRGGNFHAKCSSRCRRNVARLGPRPCGFGQVSGDPDRLPLTSPQLSLELVSPRHLGAAFHSSGLSLRPRPSAEKVGRFSGTCSGRSISGGGPKRAKRGSPGMSLRSLACARRVPRARVAPLLRRPTCGPA